MSWKRLLTSGCAAVLISSPAMAADGSGTAGRTDAAAIPVIVAQAEQAANPGAPRQLAPTPAPSTDVRPETAVRKTPVEKDLVGKPVFNESGRKVATIDHVVVDPRSNEKQIVLAYGGFLGFGQRKVAVPYDRIGVREDIPTISLSREALDKMPEFKPRPD